MEDLYKEKKTYKKVLKIISNIVFAFVMCLLIVFIIYGFGSLSKNKVPSFFGQSYVRIMSGSMANSGFNKGDVVMIKKVNLSEIKEGDIIAFYDSTSPAPPFISEDEILNTEIKDFKTGESSFSNTIIFHKINKIAYDKDGNSYYQTYGTSNVDSLGNVNYDYFWTRGDRIVGVYQESGMASFIQFLSSGVGIAVLVIVPSCIVLLILSFSIIDTIDKMMKKKKADNKKSEAIIKEASSHNKEE